MVLLPEEAEMTLAELRQIAARQQNQIEMQQQLLIVKEQRLKFLKQQEARHHMTEQNIETSYLQNLKEKVETQELKLRQLRALHGQVEQQKTSNCNLGAELESVRALFSEKEKELSIAVSKVEELTRQLNEIRKNNTRKPMMAPLAVNEIEDLRRELMYRTKLTEQQNHHISQQRGLISERQGDICQMDDKIAELTQRLRRKRLMNQQLANQIHNAALARHSNPPYSNTHSSINIATVEPVQREVPDTDQTRDDLAAKLSGIHRNDLYEFSLKKNDPKYQTLPYNTKFYLKGKTNHEDSSQPEDESSDSLTDSCSGNMQDSNAHSLVDNIVPPHPFANSTTSNSKASIAKTSVQHPDKDTVVVLPTTKPTTPVQVVSALPETFNSVISNDLPKGDATDSTNSVLISKQKLLGKMQMPADYKKTKEKFNGAVVKPVVPPKPTFPVKPVPPPRQTPTKESPHSDDKNDIVSKAISVLQNRSSEKEKNAFSNYKERLLYYRYVSRYNLHKTPAIENSATDPKVSTYFPIPSASVPPKSSTNFQENIRKKPSGGQLPIKPKPLTIRKTPGLEPPKLKVQQNSSQSSAYRKVQDTSFLSSGFKPIVSPPLAESPQLSDNILPQEITNHKLEVEDASSSEHVPKPAVSEPKVPPSITIEEIEALDAEERAKSDEKQNDHFQIPEPEDSDGSSSSPCDSLECVPIDDSSEGSKNESGNGMHDLAFNTYHRVKGNLKTEASVRSPRRVSFDPLALLLDAALEGELELVKKTAHEVPNPSAANDEGITALHNSICAGHFEVVTFLVEFGCDVNAQDSDGWTPLHCAASCNNLPMVEFLVERGACIFATTLSDHETAAEKCEEDEEGFDGCSEYLYGLQENLGIINNGVVYAVYDYEGQNSDELSFKDGNAISVLRNGDEQEQEWWWARVNDEEGYIPRNLLGLYPRISMKKERE